MSRHYSDAISEADFYGPGDMDYEQHYATEPDPDTPNADDEEISWPQSRIDDAADRSRR